MLVLVVTGQFSNCEFSVINTFIHVLCPLSIELTLIWHDGGDRHCQLVKAQAAQSLTELIPVFFHLTSLGKKPRVACSDP